MEKVNVLAAALLCGLSGCATKTTKPTATMGLAQAICEVQNAIVRTKRHNPAQRAGLGVADATVTLALGVKHTAGTEATGKLTVGVVEWAAKGSYSRESSRVNTLTIRFGPGGTHMVDPAEEEAAAAAEPLPDCAIRFKE